MEMTLMCGYLITSYLLGDLWTVAEDYNMDGDLKWDRVPPIPASRAKLQSPRSTSVKIAQRKRMLLNSPSVARSSRVSCQREEEKLTH